MNNNNDTTNPRPTTPPAQIVPLRPERNLNAAPLAPDRPAQIARPRQTINQNNQTPNNSTNNTNNQTPNNSTNNASVTNGNPRGR